MRKAKRDQERPNEMMEKKRTDKLSMLIAAAAALAAAVAAAERNLLKKAQLNLSQRPIVQCFENVYVSHFYTNACGRWGERNAWSELVRHRHRHRLTAHTQNKYLIIFGYFVCFSPKLLKTRTLAANSIALFCFIVLFSFFSFFFCRASGMSFEVSQPKWNNKIQKQRCRRRQWSACAVEYHWNQLNSIMADARKHEIARPNQLSDRN